MPPTCLRRSALPASPERDCSASVPLAQGYGSWGAWRYAVAHKGMRMTAQPRAADAVRLPPPGKITFEEFLDWCDEDTLAEWVDGEVVLISPAAAAHQRV